jgi:hypothetical protein
MLIVGPGNIHPPHSLIDALGWDVHRDVPGLFQTDRVSDHVWKIEEIVALLGSPM